MRIRFSTIRKAKVSEPIISKYSRATLVQISTARKFAAMISCP